MRKYKSKEMDEVDHNLIAIPNHEASMIEKETVEEFISQLGNRERLVVHMFHIENFNHKEIAQILEIGESSSRSILARAMKKMKVYFKESEENEKKGGRGNIFFNKAIF